MCQANYAPVTISLQGYNLWGRVSCMQTAVQLHTAAIFLYVLANRDGNSDLLSSMQIRTQPHVSASYAVVSHSTPLRDMLLISNPETLCLSLQQVANVPDRVVFEYLSGPVSVCATSQSALLRLSWLERGRPGRVDVKNTAARHLNARPEVAIPDFVIL